MKVEYLVERSYNALFLGIGVAVIVVTAKHLLEILGKIVNFRSWFISDCEKLL